MTDGRLALVFDDGYLSDHADIRPVLAEADAPASLAIVPSWLGGDGHLDESRLAELAADGWEVIAHGRRHRYLQAHRLAADVSAGDERVRLDSEHVFPTEDHAVYPGDGFELADAATAESCTIAEKRAVDGDPVVELEAPISASFAVDEAVFRPSEATVRDEIGGGKRDLEALGYDPTTFVFPYDAADARAWSVAAAAYAALPNAGVGSLPNPPETPGASLRRYYLETTHMTEGEIATYLDAVADCGGLGILAGHSAWESVPPERVGWVVEAARERDVAVTTVREAVADGT
ncbi:MAG: polysaccharide deacetylase family protein [Haloarculaceae archaeon]